MTLDAAMALTPDEDRAMREGLIARASALVGRDGISDDFVRDLFGRVPSEDLGRYSAKALGGLAVAAQAHLAAPRRPGGVAHVRLVDVTVGRDGRAQDLTVVEVVNDDRAYLLESTLAELNGRGLMPLLVAHPILGVARDAEGALVRVVGEATAEARHGGPRESFIHIHLDRLDEPEARIGLSEGLARVYADVAVVTDDHGAMLRLIDTLLESDGYREPIPHLPETETREAAAFLEWLRDGHFTPLGMRTHVLDGAIVPDFAGTELGLLRDPAFQVLRLGRSFVDMTPEIAAF
ncbi:MAG: NAD-glutamate dehydrogenase, partial [Methylobacterium sp.]